MKYGKHGAPVRDGVADGNRLYCMSDGRYMKVGQSLDPRVRLQQVRNIVRKSQAGALLFPDDLDWRSLHLVTSAPAEYDLEVYAHECLRDWHVVGEWFHDSLGLRSRIAHVLRQAQMNRHAA